MSDVPKQIVELVRGQCILLSEKARYALDTGNFDTDDLVYSIIHGKVAKKEIDETKQSYYKYIIIGPSKSGIPLYSCGKIVTVDQKKYFIITFHSAR